MSNGRISKGKSKGKTSAENGHSKAGARSEQGQKELRQSRVRPDPDLGLTKGRTSKARDDQWQRRSMTWVVQIKSKQG